MIIKLELLKNEITELINNRFDEFDIDAGIIADTTAISAISEIQKIIKSDLSDFEAIERIVKVFERYNLDCGERHDY
ncbi:MAG: hypothetical protein ACI38A_04415 [Candidatus Ornithomonoglobus sp.]